MLTRVRGSTTRALILVPLPLSRLPQPGNWLSYQISLKLDKRDVSVLEELLRDLRLTSPFPASYANAASADIPDSMQLPPNPQALLSSIVRYPFPLRYLFEGLISYGIIAPEDLTFLTTELSRAPGESQQQREKLLASLFSMGKISGRIPPVIEGASAPFLSCSRDAGWLTQDAPFLPPSHRAAQEARCVAAGQAAAAARRPRPARHRHTDAHPAASAHGGGASHSHCRRDRLRAGD